MGILSEGFRGTWRTNQTKEERKMEAIQRTKWALEEHPEWLEMPIENLEPAEEGKMRLTDAAWRDLMTKVEKNVFGIDFVTRGAVERYISSLRWGWDASTN